MNTQQLDALFIGFGKGGKTLAAFLAQKGWEVALVEQSKQMYGGTCINIACIPSKSLSNSAQQAARRHFETQLEKQDAYQNAVQDKDNLVSFPLAFQHGLGGRGLVPAGAGKSSLVNDQPKTGIAQRNDLGSAPVVGVLTLILVIRAGSFHGEEGGRFWLFFFGLGLGGLLGSPVTRTN